MRRIWIAVALVAVFATSMTAASNALAAKVVRTAPGAFDLNCNGGRGDVLPVPDVANADSFHAVTLKSGVVIVGITYISSSRTSTSPPFVLKAIQPDCTTDIGFGVNGTDHLRWPGNYIGMPQAMAPSVDGGLFVFGGSNGRLIATKLDSNGQIDRNFAHNGWLVRALPGFMPSVEYFPDVSALVQEHDGTILLGSSNGAPHCCTVPRVYAFTAAGRLEWSFVPNSDPTSKVLPMGTEINQLVPRSDGTVLILAGIVFAGCGSQELATLDQSGHLERAVTANLQRAVAALPANQDNWADGFLDAHGSLTLVGGEETRCNNGLSTPRDFVQHVGRSGDLQGRPIRWLSPNAGGWYSFGTALPGGAFVASATNSSGNVLALHSYSKDGVKDASFGHGGTVTIRKCAWDAFFGSCSLVSPSGGAVFLPGPSGDFDVVVTRPQGLTLFEIGQ